MSTVLHDTCSLGEVLDIISGFAFKSEYFNEKKIGLPLIRCRDVNTGLANVYYSGEYEEQYFVRNGDLLVSMDGDFRIVRWQHSEALLNQRVCRLEPHVGKLDPTYLLYFLPKELDRIHAKTSFATVKHLSSKTLREIEIPLPPLPEQKRIADILDKADAIRRKRRKAASMVDDVTPAIFGEMFGDPVTNEKNWPLRPFGELAANQDGRRMPVKASDRAHVQGEYPYYGASGIIDYVDSYLFDETSLLIAEDGANLLARSTPIAFIANGKYWVNNHAHVVTENGMARLRYLSTHLNLRNIRDFVTGSAQPKLNQANLNKIPIPYPPLSLQDEFDRRLDAVALIRAKQSDADTDADAVFNSLVQKAFLGGLS